MTANQQRRRFLKQSAGAAFAASLITAKGSTVAADANQRLRIGFIGPGGRGFKAHVGRLCQLHAEGRKIDLVAVAEVYKNQRDKVADHIKQATGIDPGRYVDYRDMIEKEKLDAVCIATPDHWHHRQAVDALNAGLHVYCEKPMTKTVEEAFDVEKAWRESGKVMQVGVQSSSLPIWNLVRGMLNEGRLGKVLGYQTEYFRNSDVGQWRYYKLTPEMTPKAVDWKRWLGIEHGLSPEVPFDREVYAQWRRFWPYGSGMFTDLFVHRTTTMLKATGLRLPRRIVGAGGIFMEYDGRQVPDVATVVADFDEGVQGLVTATMCNQESRINQLIRGHYGTLSFGNNKDSSGVDFIAERPQVTHQRDYKDERITTEGIGDATKAHFANWIDAIEAGDPMACNNTPDLGAAAIAVVILGAQSYRNGEIYFLDPETRQVSNRDPGWATGWEKRSAEHSKPKHIPGWNAGDFGSVQRDPDYMNLGGPWVDGRDPAESS